MKKIIYISILIWLLIIHDILAEEPLIVTDKYIFKEGETTFNDIILEENSLLKGSLYTIKNKKINVKNTTIKDNANIHFVYSNYSSKYFLHMEKLVNNNNNLDMLWLKNTYMSMGYDSTNNFSKNNANPEELTGSIANSVFINKLHLDKSYIFINAKNIEINNLNADNKVYLYFINSDKVKINTSRVQSYMNLFLKEDATLDIVGNGFKSLSIKKIVRGETYNFDVPATHSINVQELQSTNGKVLTKNGEGKLKINGPTKDNTTKIDDVFVNDGNITINNIDIKNFNIIKGEVEYKNNKNNNVENLYINPIKDNFILFNKSNEDIHIKNLSFKKDDSEFEEDATIYLNLFALKGSSIILDEFDSDIFSTYKTASVTNSTKGNVNIVFTKDVQLKDYLYNSKQKGYITFKKNATIDNLSIIDGSILNLNYSGGQELTINKTNIEKDSKLNITMFKDSAKLVTENININTLSSIAKNTIFNFNGQNTINSLEVNQGSVINISEADSDEKASLDIKNVKYDIRSDKDLQITINKNSSLSINNENTMGKISNFGTLNVNENLLTLKAYEVNDDAKTIINLSNDWSSAFLDPNLLKIQKKTDTINKVYQGIKAETIIGNVDDKWEINIDNGNFFRVPKKNIVSTAIIEADNNIDSIEKVSDSQFKFKGKVPKINIKDKYLDFFDFNITALNEKTIGVSVQRIISNKDYVNKYTNNEELLSLSGILDDIREGEYAYNTLPMPYLIMADDILMNFSLERYKEYVSFLRPIDVTSLQYNSIKNMNTFFDSFLENNISEYYNKGIKVWNKSYFNLGNTKSVIGYVKKKKEEDSNEGNNYQESAFSSDIGINIYYDNLMFTSAIGFNNGSLTYKTQDEEFIHSISYITLNTMLGVSYYHIKNYILSLYTGFSYTNFDTNRTLFVDEAESLDSSLKNYAAGLTVLKVLEYNKYNIKFGAEYDINYNKSSPVKEESHNSNFLKYDFYSIMGFYHKVIGKIKADMKFVVNNQYLGSISTKLYGGYLFNYNYFIKDKTNPYDLYVNNSYNLNIYKDTKTYNNAYSGVIMGGKIGYLYNIHNVDIAINYELFIIKMENWHNNIGISIKYHFK